MFGCQKQRICGILSLKSLVALRYDVHVNPDALRKTEIVVVVVVLLFYIHGKHLWSCRDGHLT